MITSCKCYSLFTICRYVKQTHIPYFILLSQLRVDSAYRWRTDTLLKFIQIVSGRDRIIEPGNSFVMPDMRTFNSVHHEQFLLKF